MKISIPEKRTTLILAAILVIAVVALYLPARNFAFINMDDSRAVSDNPVVNKGITWYGLKKVLTETKDHFWLPVTWMSFMVEVELFGIEPGPFHRTNFILHALNALLFFTFLHRATGSPWKSFFAAALWALHPLRVESIAWIVERKDSLSGLFFLLCLLFYLLHHEKGRLRWYIASVAAMLAGLMSKPTIVMLPLVLVIVDFWPLNKFEGGLTGENVLRSLRGKIPFFVLSAIFSVTTMLSKSAALGDGNSFPLTFRLAEFTASNLYYVGKTLWPVRLFLVPRVDSFSLEGIEAVIGALLLLTATYLFIKARKYSPAIPAGWLWYVAVLLPVSGILTIGFTAIADRYSYLPAMGLSFMAVWGVDGIIGKRENLRRAAAVFGALCLAAFFARASFQLALWKDGKTFFTYNYEKTNSAFSERMLAGAYTNKREFDKAIELYEDSLKKDPRDAETYNSLGFLYSKTGRIKESEAAFRKAAQMIGTDPSAVYEETARIYIEQGFYENAIKNAQKAIEINPDNLNAVYYLAKAASEAGNFGLADETFKTLVKRNPGDFEGRYEYGKMLANKGDHEGALVQFEEAIRLAPEGAESRIGAGLELARLKRLGEAVDQFREAVRLDPENLKGNFYLALAASQTGQNALAIEQYGKYLSLAPEDPVGHLNLGKLYALTGNRKEAAKHLEEALRLNPGDAETIEELRKIR